MRPDNEECKCEFLFAALAEKHNAVIRKIREIPPWEWGGEFLELEPQVLRVHWEIEGTDRSGDIPAAKLSSEIDRIDIAADALDELKEAEYDGKTAVFTVRGNFASAKISATLRYVVPEPLRISITDAKAIASGRIVRIKCENAEGVSGYHEDDVCFGFMADISVNGVNKGELSFGGPKDGSLDGYVEIESIPFSAGDTVKVTVHPDPEKTEYVQEDSSFTATAE